MRLGCNHFFNPRRSCTILSRDTPTVLLTVPAAQLPRSFDHFVLSLEELGVLLYGCKGPRSKRGMKVLTEIIFPRADRKFANPVFKHFKRPDVQVKSRAGPLPTNPGFEH